jgi:hypothetical protein
MGILDDYRQNEYGPGTNFRPETNFKPQLFNQQVASPMNNAANSPSANTQEDPGAEQRKKLIKQSTGASPHLPFEEDIQGAAKEHGVPYDLLHGILRTESSFNPNAVPRDPKTGVILSSAKGLGQFIDSTAKEMGVTDRFDPKQNIYGAARYLKQNYDKFGDWEKAASAYNLGPTAVRDHGITNPDYLKKVFGTAGPHTETPGMATPGSSIGGSQPSLAGMDKDQMIAFNDTMPAATRSIHAIRGNTESWFNPQQSREFATLGESLRGQPGEATYATQQAERIATDKNTALKDATRIEQTLKNQGLADERSWTEKQLTDKQAADNLAKKALEAVEGSGSKTATPGAQPSSPPKYQTKEEKDAWEEMLSQMEMKRKEEEKDRQAKLGGVQRFGLEDY